MNSWRDSASTAAQADLDQLLAAATEFAQENLAKKGDFYPFGAKVTTDGTLKLINTQSMATDGMPHLDDMVALCRSAMRGKRDHLRAAAIVELVEADGAPAIRIELEHQDGISLYVVQPYIRKHFTHVVKLGEPVTSDGTPHIWA